MNTVIPMSMYFCRWSGPPLRKMIRALVPSSCCSTLIGDRQLTLGLSHSDLLAPEEMSGEVARLRNLVGQAVRSEHEVELGFSIPVVFDGKTGSPLQMMRDSPEQIFTDLRQYQDLGIRNFIQPFTVDFRIGEPTDRQDAIEQFAKGVIPLFPSE